MKEPKKTLTPKLRFPEFRDRPGWSACPLEHIAERVTTRNADGSHTRVLTNSAEHGVIDQRDYFDREIASPGNLNTYYVVERGDYVYNPRASATAPVGPISRNNLGTGVMSPLYMVFRFTNDHTDFYEHYFRSGAWHSYLRAVASMGARHDRMSITSSAFMEMPVPTPEPAEQRKIAACVTSLDKSIAAEGQKLEALRVHRKGLMQQLFPREGEIRPRLRFREFLDAPEWKSATLGKIADISSGTTPLRANARFYDSGTIPWVKTTDLNNSWITATEERITIEANAKINPVASVLVAMYGGFKQIGRTGILAIPAATNQALSVLEVTDADVLPFYLVTWLNAKVGDWKGIASSSRKDPNITGSDVARFPVWYPARAEQEEICACLSALEAMIAAQSRKCDGLRVYRKGLMQQLFPSPEVM
jgi:type I restriction enzyme S subunit